MKIFLSLFIFLLLSSCSYKRDIRSQVYIDDKEQGFNVIERDPQFSKKNTFPNDKWISLRSGLIILPKNSNCILEERKDPRFITFSRKMFKVDCFE
ncbi:hypothetical protein LVJ83_03085 [Uruburuella testudinis]|uniref:Lipoprotein n=1 Tax=Uruburuella testudinis TaxID=1282863 RepID=A0ABY4DSS9_9NEIS|nr:hypothetical protein [Uruburuella testudinis]UOO81478.1 hypothetical protein LVJ83_11105 [Uruburuella testudinis]UOO82469.1 hypothetical protein LVJ83_03085 [Uruburuella testudinis]